MRYTTTMRRRTVTVQVAGKLNLSLNVTGKSGGLHTLDSVVCSVDCYDVVTVCERFDGQLNVEFCAAAGTGKQYEKRLSSIPADNSVTRALRLAVGGQDVFGADIIVQKSLPFAGGMGGSSADAAAAIVAVEYLLKTNFTCLTAHSTASQVGSDVQYMRKGGFARLSGIGDRLEFFDAKNDLFFVLASCGGEVNSALCYARFDALYPRGEYSPSDNEKLIAALKSGDTVRAAAQIKNALTEPSATLEPGIPRCLSALEGAGATVAFMTGSGSVCAGLFVDKDECDRAAKQLADDGFWTRSVKSVRSGIVVREK